MERQLLATCGLNETEQEIVLCLLQYGRCGAATIAKRTGIKRPTVYSALSALEMTGLIARHVVKGSTQFSTINPKAIPGVFVAKAKNEFQRVSQAALKLENELEQYKAEARHRFGKYEISTLESAEAMYAHLESLLVKGGYRGIFDPQAAFKGRGREVGENCLRETAKTKPLIREIAVAGPMCNWWKRSIKNPNHLVREMKADEMLLTDMLLYGDTVVLTNYDPGYEMAIVIKHKDYSALMVSIFDALWNSLKMKDEAKGDVAVGA
jgi:sugar-specific transcriptional regulator TrmB